MYLPFGGNKYMLILKTDCSLNSGGHEDRFTVMSFPVLFHKKCESFTR